MKIRNIHRRTIGSAETAAALLDALASPHDVFWPSESWPAMRLDRPLGVGARGGHGPVRYHVQAYEPGTWVRFAFEAPRGVEGYHELTAHAHPDGSGELVHTVMASLHGWARLTWPLFFRPMHDVALEDALDNATRACGDTPPPRRWPPYVRLLRAADPKGRRRAVRGVAATG